jgi:hypothetical protein
LTAFTHQLLARQVLKVTVTGPDGGSRSKLDLDDIALRLGRRSCQGWFPVSVACTPARSRPLAALSGGRAKVRANFLWWNSQRSPSTH